MSLTPEEEAAMAQYYGASNPALVSAPSPAPTSTDGPNMSVAPPNMSVAPDPVSSYYGAPAAPAPSPAAPTPSPLSPDSPVSDFALGAKLSTPNVFPLPNGSLVPVVNNKAMPATAPSGPTASDDAAFETFKAKQKAASAPSGGGGYGKLQGAVDDANRRIMGNYDEAKSIVDRQGEIKSGAAMQLAARQAAIAEKQQADADIAMREEAEANGKFESHMREIETQLEDVRSKKIKPWSPADDGPVSAFTAIVGGLVGGLYQGVNHLQKNPFIEELDAEIDRRMKADQANIDNGRQNAIDKMSLLGQQRAAFKDHQLASMQARNLYYEAAKTQIMSDASETDSQLAKNEADKGIVAIQQEQDALRKQIAERALQVAQQQAAAAAAQAREAQRFRIETNLKLLELGIKEKEADAKLEEAGGKPTSPGQRFVATGSDSSGNPTGFLARNAEGAQKEEEGRKAREELIAELNDALAVREEAGTLGRALNREGKLGLYTPEWQAKLRSKAATIKAKWNKAAQLGTMDAGTAPLLDAVVGELDSVGDSSDIRLRELLDQTKRANEADTRTAAGAQVRKVIGPDGKERIEPVGGQNAPYNPKTVRREPVK